MSFYLASARRCIPELHSGVSQARMTRGSPSWIVNDKTGPRAVLLAFGANQACAVETNPSMPLTSRFA